MSGDALTRVFEDEELLGAESDLQVILTREEDDDTFQLTVSLTCKGQEVVQQVVYADPQSEEEDGAEVPLAEYLALWQSVRETGWPARAMSGEGLPEPGTDVYLIGHAGPAGLGWTVSTSLAGLTGCPEALACCEAILSLVVARSDLGAAHVGDFQS
ncbi:MAG: hypothetical protein RBU45_03710 [Myxococcota bacterium]|jgi:hypothetical protein|nr:hypothetical protein [Myxococcota bacterium]